MADNQDNQETSQASSLDQLTQAAGQLGQPHSNAVAPHKIANHDMLVQTSIWGGSDVGWINLNDTQDQLNTRMDLHKVEKAVQAQVTAIGDTVKRANDAVDQANKAIDSSNVNKAAIDAANSAIAEAKTATESAIAATVKNATAIDQNKSAISLKADQSTVDTLNKTVTDNSAAVSALNDEIKLKVDSTTVNKMIDGKGFATTNTVQSLVDQKASQISQTIADVKTTVDGNGNAISTANDKISNLTQAIDGIQTTVKNKADQSQITQLSNQLTAKVSANDYQTEIAALEKDLNLRVQKGDLISQINLEAGGDGLISVQNGKGKLMLDADSVVFGNKAFIPSAAITNIQADQITTGTLKSIQINNGGGKFTVNPNGDVVANSITLRNGQFMQGTIAGSTIYAFNNNGSQDPKLAPQSDWYKITPDMIRWFNHYDQSVGQIGVGQGVVTEGGSSFTGTPGLTISDSAKILLGTAQRTVVAGDEIGNLETTGLDWMSKTNLEIKADELKINLDPDQGYDGKGAGFAIQKDNKIGAYFGSGDNGNELSITTFGDNNHITFNTGWFSISGEVDIPHNGLTVRDLHVTRWLGVDGSKNSIVNTSQGTVAINAYETAEYYFGDIGEDQTNSDGKAWVSIEYLFSQTVNTNVPYQVFVTPYSSAHVWVSKRLNNRFLVESDKPNASFAWEIKAKRKGYEYTRLKNVDNMMEKPAGIN